MWLNISLTYNATYGILLGLLILSWHYKEYFVRLFVDENYSLGNFGQTWANWHSIGCFYVGTSSLIALIWDNSLLDAKTQICLLTSFVYGVWGMQNLYLMLFTNKMKPLMYVHVLGCGAGALLGSIQLL